MAIARGGLGVARRVEASGALAPGAADAVGLASEAGDHLAAAAAGGAGGGVMLAHRRDRLGDLRSDLQATEAAGVSPLARIA